GRPGGGDRGGAASLCGGWAPFVHRRYLDFATFDDLKTMKRRVDDSLRRGQYERDVKLGRGGIREIEFWVQAQQLVHAGKDPRLQVRGTLPALERLATGGYADRELAGGPPPAYPFPRGGGHHIHILPPPPTPPIPPHP